MKRTYLHTYKMNMDVMHVCVYKTDQYPSKPPYYTEYSMYRSVVQCVTN